MDCFVCQQKRGVAFFSFEGSNFQGNFRNRVFLGGVKFPKEFLEMCARANPSLPLSSRGSRGGYLLAALGSEDWCDPIQGGVFSDGRPSVHGVAPSPTAPPG